MKIRIYSLLLLTGAVLGCEKSVNNTQPTFTASVDNARSVTGDTLVFKLGDTCKFAIGGAADNVIFYSGESGRKYEYKDRSVALGKTMFSFSSKAEFGTQTNTLKVFATNKLSGRDSATIVNAQWTDITGRLALATNATVVNSGNIDLTDLVTNANDSLFIAFKYSGTAGSTQRSWTITNYTLNNVFADYTFNLGSLAADASYWTRFGNVWGPATRRWTPSASQLKIDGGDAAVPANTSWIVSKALYVGRVAPDVPFSIKSISGAAVPVYTYKYTATGKYKATFVAFNRSPDVLNEVVKEYNIKIVQ